MPIPKPENGLVISYSYLWRNEYSAGKLAGLKNRPCALILVAENNEAEQIVTVAPITHTAPQDINVAIEIPSKVKQHLGLDGERSWVILDDFNQFQWPGYDLRTIPKTLGEYAYGFLPPVLYAQITQRIITLHKDSLKPTPRD